MVSAENCTGHIVINAMNDIRNDLNDTQKCMREMLWKVYYRRELKLIILENTPPLNNISIDYC
jgi:hypothetical protein